MSNNPYQYGPPPYYGAPPGWPPQPPYPTQPHNYPPAHDGGQLTTPGHTNPPTHPPGHPYPYYVPGAVMVPVPMMPPHMPMPASETSQPTYITNYIYHGENPANNNSNTNNTAMYPEGQIPEFGDYDWVPTTATTAGFLNGKAVIGGREGWDGSPLWVIRAWHNDDLIPGKLSVRHHSASVPYDQKEVHVQNIEVLVSKPDNLRWIPASNGNIPPGAIQGGKTSSGEILYIGRANYQLSITPGKVHQTHNCCYIPFAGSEVSQKMYDVLCKI